MFTSYTNASVSLNRKENITDSTHVVMELGNGCVSIRNLTHYSMNVNAYQRLLNISALERM